MILQQLCFVLGASQAGLHGDALASAGEHLDFSLLPLFAALPLLFLGGVGEFSLWLLQFGGLGTLGFSPCPNLGFTLDFEP